MANSKRKCRECKDYELVDNGIKVPLGFFCSPDCAAKYGRRRHQKHEIKRKRTETRKAKEKLKTTSDWLREAQQAFNAYIRARDEGKPCISCDWTDNGKHQRHASHYRSVGACSALRFNTFNVSSSCAQCNGYKSGNILEYRIRLIKKYGEDRVHWLESQNQVVKYDIEYLKRLKKIFNRRARHVRRLRQ